MRKLDMSFEHLESLSSLSFIGKGRVMLVIIKICLISTFRVINSLLELSKTADVSQDFDLPQA